MTAGDFVKRGEIWWASLHAPVGSEAGFDRPVVIVQRDTFNRSRLSTTLAVPLTTKVERSAAPGNVLLPKEHTGLPRTSVANVTLLLHLDKSALLHRVGDLPAELLEQIEHGLRLVLDLD